MINFLVTLQFVLFVFFSVAYAYQIIYLLIGLLGKERKGKAEAEPKRYAVMIAARNEQAVIGELIDSLRKQRYPKDMLDIYVIADNCTDNTAQVARSAGACVVERFNKRQVGKGYALDFLLKEIDQKQGLATYAGYFVFDADNLVDESFVLEMNKMFQSDHYAALTSYRNSKNFCDNWITAGYSLWFLREARFLNRPRAKMGLNCAISGTGFLVSSDVIMENGGWPFHLLTEDIEFSIDCTTRGYKIGYCGTAVIYDEQPTEFGQSWTQRMRWAKGFYQVDVKYTGALLRGTARGGKKGFSCYDMLMTVAPCSLVTIGALLISVLMCFASVSQPSYIIYRVVRMVLRIFSATLRGVSFSLFLFGLATMATEWKKIEGTPARKLFYTLTFPLFMLTYIPISISALVQKVEWKPIRHTSMLTRENKIE